MTGFYEHSRGDTSLMKAVSSGNMDALATLMDKYIYLISRTSFRILCDRRDSEAVTEEVFFRVWTAAADYDMDVPLQEWLMQLTCRLSRRRITLRRFRYVLAMRPDVFATSEPLFPIVDDYINKQAWESYCRACSKLTASQRIIYTLTELEGLALGQVSRITGYSMYRIRYALRKAEEKYEGYHSDVEFLRKMAVLLTDKEKLEHNVLARCSLQ